MLFGTGSEEAKQAVNDALTHVRDTSNFNWTFIFILAVVFYVYWTEIKNKNYKAVVAGLALYSVHWLYEIANAVICRLSGYPLWAVSAQSTTFILLIGVSWELSMMFSIAGIISYKMLLGNPYRRLLAKGKFRGFTMRSLVTVAMALLFSVIEIFLAGTANGSFIWVYPWWGALPVFVTTYIPFFLAANYVPDMRKKTRNVFLCSLVALNVLLLAVLVPLGVI